MAPFILYAFCRKVLSFQPGMCSHACQIADHNYPNDTTVVAPGIWACRIRRNGCARCIELPERGRGSPKQAHTQVNTGIKEGKGRGEAEGSSLEKHPQHGQHHNRHGGQVG